MACKKELTLLSTNCLNSLCFENFGNIAKDQMLKFGRFGWFCNKGRIESCDLVNALKSVKFLLKRVKVFTKAVKKCKVFTKAR